MGCTKRGQVAERLYEKAGTGKKRKQTKGDIRAEERKARIQKGENEIY